MNAKEFYLNETGWESLDQVEEFDTPEEVIELMKKYADHCEVPDREEEMREMLSMALNRLENTTEYEVVDFYKEDCDKIRQLLNK